MKSLFRIICRYSLTVGFITLIILVSNVCLFAGILYFTAGQGGLERYSKMSMEAMEQIGEEFIQTEDACTLSEDGINILEETEFVWAMALDQDGNVVWQWKLPPEIPTQYTLQQVASFTRWYLEDYPVKVLISGERLLVFGCSQELISRYNLLVSSSFVRHIPVYGSLMMRALRNLLGNSIRHNPEGCLVTVSLTRQDGFLLCLVRDTGAGIPKEVVENMENPESSIHIMGLRLTEQIARAHGGSLEFVMREEGGWDAGIRIPQEKSGLP